MQTRQERAFVDLYTHACNIRVVFSICLHVRQGRFQKLAEIFLRALILTALMVVLGISHIVRNRRLLGASLLENMAEFLRIMLMHILFQQH